MVHAVSRRGAQGWRFMPAAHPHSYLTDERKSQRPHTVQWNISEEYRLLGLDTSPGKSEEQLASFYDYERDASRFSLQLLHDAGVHDLDRWVSDWWYADWEYLAHYYRTGEKLDTRALLRPGQGDVLTPLPIPAFTPQRWMSRWSF